MKDILKFRYLFYSLGISHNLFLLFTHNGKKNVGDEISGIFVHEFFLLTIGRLPHFTTDKFPKERNCHLVENGEGQWLRK